MFRNSLNANIFMFKMVGAWPRKCFSKAVNYAYLAIVVCFYLVPVSCFPLIYIYLHKNTDLVKISQTAFVSGELALIAPKLIHFVLIHEKVKSVVGYWDTHSFSTLAPSRANEIIGDEMKQARKLTKWFTVLTIATSTTWAIKPFQDFSHRTLPADMWLPFDPFQNDVVYALTFLHFSVVNFLSIFLLSYTLPASLFPAGTLCAVSNATIDTGLCNLLLQATAQMKVLKEALMNLGKNECELNTEDGLKKCALHFSAIVKFVRSVESIFDFTLFIQVFGSTVAICCSAFMMTVMSFYTLDFLALVVYTTCVVVELFLLCYYGTVLYEASANITEAIYLWNWVDYDRSTKKGLLILMERTKRPLKLFAGGLIEISLDTFTGVLRKAYSLFAVLQNMYTN